jgi:predicted TIM-barrel fold metal-dependent hydrolase
MILDGHIHIFSAQPDGDALLRRLQAAGVDGGVLLSLPPASCTKLAQPVADRLHNLSIWCAASANLYPFFWIDPTEEDALAQVELAVGQGVRGFKIICNHFYPGDARALPVYQAISDAERPILFHSGILWDGRFSSKYNRPAEFEALLSVPGLHFALAHISWPWCDELLAVYGKFQHSPACQGERAVEMFIDITPGTPPIYREEALSKLFTIGYDVRSHVLFGSDSAAHDYNAQSASTWITRDNAIYRKLGLDAQTFEGIYAENLLRFLGEKYVAIAPVQY